MSRHSKDTDRGRGSFSRGRSSGSSFERGRGGSRGRSSGSDFNSRPPKAERRAEDKNGQFVLNIFNIAGMSLEGISHMHITTVCEGVTSPNIRGTTNLNERNKIRGLKILENEANRMLEEKFGYGKYTFDGSASVILPKGVKGEAFDKTVRLGRDTFAQDVTIVIEPGKGISSDATQEELELIMTALYKTMTTRVIESMSGRMDRNTAYPLPASTKEFERGTPEGKFATTYRKIVGAISEKNSNDVRSLHPFTVGRGFDPRVQLMRAFPVSSSHSVEEEIANGKIQCFLQVNLKSGAYLHSEILATELIDKLRNGLCYNRNGDEDKIREGVKETIDGMYCYRTYDKRDHPKWEIVKGVHDVAAGNVRFEMDKDGKKISMKEYFAKKGINIDERLHPIVIVGRGGKPGFLPQELTMFTAQFVRGFNTPIQGKTTNLSRTKPNDYRSLVVAFTKLIHEHEVGKTFQKVWGMQLKSDDPLYVDGFESRDPSVVYGGGKTAVVARGTWNLRGLNLNIQSNEVEELVVLDLSGSKAKELEEFVKAFRNTHINLGWKCNLKIDRLELPRKGHIGKTLPEPLQNYINGVDENVSGVYVILPRNTGLGDDAYKVVKTVVDGLSLPTQCMKPTKTPMLNMRAMRGGPDQHFSNIICGMSIKTSNLNQTLKKTDWTRLGIEASPSTMILGIDLQHSRKVGAEQRLSTIAMVGTIDETFCLTVSSGQTQEYETDLMKPALVTRMMNNILKQREARGITVPIKNLVILRDGVDTGSYDEMIRVEVDIINDALKARGFNAQISVLVIMKKHGIRVLPRDENSEYNIAPGTCANVKPVGPKGDDLGFQRIARVPHFYVMMHHAIAGSTAVPARVALVKNPLDIQPSVWASLLYYWAHLDAVVQKTVSLPHATLFAHKACERVGQLLDQLRLGGSAFTPDELNKKLIRLMENLPNSGFL